MCRLSRNALEFTALFLSGNKTTDYCFINRTILECLGHSKCLVNTRNKFHISTHPCTIADIYKQMLENIY